MKIPEGVYYESSRGMAPADSTTELYCLKCDRVLARIPAGGMRFEQYHGDCTCSWGCCGVSNDRHPRHLGYRVSEVEVAEFTRLDKETDDERAD